MPRTLPARRLAVICVLVAGAPGALRAQWQEALGPRGATLGAPVGSDVERYVRALALAGLVEPIAWANRGFDTDDVERLFAQADTGRHPWREALRGVRGRRASAGAAVTAGWNSGFPWGANDGPRWQGRGANAAVGAAATVRVGPLRATLAPVAWTARNAAFPLMPTAGPTVYGDPLFPFNVDLPQRLGPGPASRLALGESSIRLAAGGFVAGASTASLGWGPQERFPALLGANAGGFPHVFVGTRPSGTRIPLVGRLAGRYVFGVLSQSRWSPVAGSDTFVDRIDAGRRRVGVGVTASVLPSLLPGLELGASRFFHSPYRSGTAFWRPWAKPFEGILKSDLGVREPDSPDPTGDLDNQLASFFARWVFPRRGIELTFEAFRDDHSWDRRDLAQEPEQNGAVAAGLRVLTHRRGDRLGVLALEYFDGDVRRIAQQRPQGLLYQHHIFRQGHTLDGQLLGQPLGIGAIDGQSLAWERFGPRDRLRVALERWRPRSRPSGDPQGLFDRAVSRDGRAHDVIYDLSFGLTRFTGPSARTLETGFAWAGVWQFGPSRANAYLRLGATLF